MINDSFDEKVATSRVCTWWFIQFVWVSRGLRWRAKCEEIIKSGTDSTEHNLVAKYHIQL